MATIYEMFNGNNPIAEGTIKQLAEKFGVNESSLRDSYYRARKVQGMYTIRLKEFDGSNLSKKQKEIIETKMKLGKSIEDIYNETGIERRDINTYIESLRAKESKVNQEDIEELVERLIDKKLSERKEPVETTISFKTLGYEYSENDKEWVVKDYYNQPIKMFKFSKEAVHIRKVDSDKKMSTPYTISCKEIEAIYDEIVKKRGY